MVKKLTIYLIIATFLVSFIPVLPTKAAMIIVTNTQVGNFQNGTAKLTWTTDNPTKGSVYYGLSTNQLDNWMSFGTYDYQHSLVLSGLVKDKTYFYKIIVQDQAGLQTETYVQTFSTKGMVDTISPEILEITILQATGNAVALYWRTDEKSKATINFHPDDTEVNKSIGYGGLDIDHVIFIYGLTPRKNYVAQIVAQDQAGNKRTGSTYFYTSDGIRDASSFQIYNIQPLSFDPNRIFSDTAIINWETNIAAKTSISYGTKSGSYSKTLTASGLPHTEHQVIITNLKPNTTYYYKIRAWGGIYNKSLDSGEYSFTTIPLQGPVTPTPTPNNSPIDPSSYKDSDRDGYPDNLEIKNGYNPYGYGRPLNIVAANLKKTTSPESKQAKRLNSIIQQRLGKVPVDSRLWLALVNASTYGGYPDEAIIKAVQHKGKTVHAAIPFFDWQNSTDYQNYIDK